MHSIYCDKKHPEQCTYHEEDELDNRWSRPCHKEWAKKGREIIDRILYIFPGQTEEDIVEAYKNTFSETYLDPLKSLLQVTATFGPEILTLLDSNSECWSSSSGVTLSESEVRQLLEFSETEQGEVLSLLDSRPST